MQTLWYLRLSVDHGSDPQPIQLAQHVGALVVGQVATQDDPIRQIRPESEVRRRCDDAVDGLVRNGSQYVGSAAVVQRDRVVFVVDAHSGLQVQ